MKKEIVIRVSTEAHFGPGWEDTGLTERDLIRAEDEYVRRELQALFPMYDIDIVHSGICSCYVVALDDGEENREVSGEVRFVLRYMKEISELPLRQVYELAGKNPDEAPTE